jgi:molybdenum cofactor synthesis domain-containing protein
MTEMEKIAAIVVASDSRADGTREDLTGPAAVAALAELGIGTLAVTVVKDDFDALADKLAELADRGDVLLLLTCGGTGLGPRDVTPEATLEVIERAVPGIPQLLRQRGLEVTPHAALSRGIAGIRGRTLVVNLPGSPRAVREGISFLAPILPHALATVAGRAVECAALRED